MTHTILHIDSSPLGDHSVSRKLTAKLVADLKAKHADSTIVTRDFGAKPLPHLTAPVIGAFFTPAEQRTDEQAEVIKLSDQLVDEVVAAKVIVIGAPMWNFGIPSSLKAWIDHIVRKGRTFTYTATGPTGMLAANNTKVIIVSSRGGVYSEGPMAAMDHQETYLKAVLGFVGLTDVTFIRAEGVSMGEDAVKKAMATAESQTAAAVKQVA